jgi:hypothetical protein
MVSIKNLSNIILKREGVVIKYIEQFLKYKSSIQILNSLLTYLTINEIDVKEFAFSFITDDRTDFSNKIIDYVNLNFV